MGFIDSIKGALGGEGKGRAAPDARHVDREAPPETSDAAPVSGGKHAARD